MFSAQEFTCMLQRACDRRGSCCLLTCALLVVLLFACRGRLSMRLKYACSVAAVVGGRCCVAPYRFAEQQAPVVGGRDCMPQWLYAGPVCDVALQGGAG